MTPSDPISPSVSPPAGPPGLLVAFEGVDGSGKSTQLRRLSARLGEAKIPHTVTKEPGATPLGKKLREILLDPALPASALAQLFLFQADRAQHRQEVLSPALDRGGIVLSDRLSDATMAYQAFGFGLSRELVATLTRVALDGLRPDLTVLLDLPVEALEGRLSARAEGRTRFERLGRDYFDRVRRGYLEIARVHADRTLFLDATLPPDLLEKQIDAELARRFPGRFGR